MAFGEQSIGIGILLPPHVPLPNGSNQNSLTWWQLGEPGEKGSCFNFVRNLFCLSICMPAYTVYIQCNIYMCSVITLLRTDWVNQLSHNLAQNIYFAQLKLAARKQAVGHFCGVAKFSYQKQTITLIANKQNALCGNAVGGHGGGGLLLAIKLQMNAYFLHGCYDGSIQIHNYHGTAKFV